MKKSIIITLALFTLAGFVSCTHRLTDFTVISTKNVPLGEGVNNNFQKGTKRVKGEDVSHMVLCLPLGYPNMKEAIDRAIEAVPGAIGLADGVVKSSSWTCLFYGQNKYIVEGTPLFPTDYDYERDNSGLPKNYHHNEPVAVPFKPQSQYQQPTTASATETVIFYHKVKTGESIHSIAELYNVSISDIIKWNKLSSNDIKTGDKLTLHLSN